MGYICKLTRGALTLDLNDNEYSLASGFAPPAILETASIAVGTSANRYGGGRKVDERVLPREYSFTIKANGTSNAQCEQAIDRLDTFLRQGTDADPVYFCFKPDNNVGHEPLWGQFGATRRCKVLTGHCEKSGEIYGEARSKVIFADVSLTINGVEGLNQRVGEATGGIIENTMFSPDGISRGLMIPEATDNYITNPVFGHATYTNDWTVGAGVICSKNTDKEFVLPGASASAKVTGISAANNYIKQENVTLAATTWTNSWYVKLPDGGAVSATQCDILYGVEAQTETYTAMGNGWYRVSASYTGSGVAADILLQVKNSYTVYVGGAQLENKAYPTPLCWGDLMGCSWAGTAHDSTSTRTAARWSILTSSSVNDILNIAEGTIRLIWMPDKANTSLTADIYLFENTGALGDVFSARFDNDDEKFYFTDGTNTISSSATTYATGTPIVLHYVYEAGSLKIYRAGAEIATGSTYTPTDIIMTTPNFFLGSDSSTTRHCNGTFLGLTTFSRAMSATEVANDYTNIYQHINGGDGYGQMLETIPWRYDGAGDGIIDAYCDATHWDWIICGSIPGSLPAATVFYTQNSADNRSLTIANHQSQIFHSPSNYFSAADATAAGLNTTATLGKAINVAASIQKDLCQYSAYLWASLHDHGANLTIAPRVELSTSAVGHTGDYRPITTSTTNKDFLTYGIGNIENNPEIKYLITGIIFSDSVDYELWLQRSADGAADVTIDYMRVMFGSLTYIYNDVAADSDSILMDKDIAYIINSSGYTVVKTTKISGDLFELHPNTLNHVILQTGDLGADTVAAATTTIQYIEITPRWALA